MCLGFIMSIYCIDPTGSLLIPAEELIQLGLQPGDSVRIEVSETGLLLRKLVTAESPVISVQQAINRKNLTTGIQFIKGVGPKLAELLAKRGIHNVEDALFCLPHRYEDRRQLIPVKQLKPGLTQAFQGTVVSAESSTTKGGRKVFEAVVQDESGSIVLKWFHANAVWMKRTWQIGRQGVFTGEVTSFGWKPEVHHPDVEWLEKGADVNAVLAADPVNFGRIVPVYPLTEGLHQKGMRRVMRQVVDTFLANLENILPQSLLGIYQYLPLQEALGQGHLTTFRSTPDRSQ